MSGICGIVQSAGAVDRQVLHEMTTFLAFRGPDAQDVWIEGSAGLGHAMLRTTFESQHERQPVSMDGEAWITADARIDGRTELTDKLEAMGGGVLDDATDAQLILHAYRAWGEGCVKELIGDFAFAIWDGPRRRLFCAHDHFGVKPFFYARAGGGLIFSNTLDCVRRHPSVSAALDDTAIADFLLFEMHQDPAATAFADIRRLPPAHCLTWTAEGSKVRRYWTLSTDAEIRYRRANEYVEHFRDLLGTAVADRLRTRRVAVSMSGGLDSSAIAATAKSLLARSPDPFELHAHTVVYDRLVTDEERHFSAMVAQKLRIPIHHRAADAFELYEHGGFHEMHSPEPLHAPQGAVSRDLLKSSSAHCRVLLTGWDGDALLSESPKPYFRKLLGEGRFGLLFIGMMCYAVSQRRLVPLGWRDWLPGSRAKAVADPPFYPAWLSPDLERRLELRARWDAARVALPVSHGVRPYAHRALSYLMRMSSFFDRHDAGVTRLPLECRHPLLDLRLVDFCLSLPPHPWCVKKEILRAAMRGVLPEAVRLRPKTPLGVWPGLEMLHRAGARWMDRFESAPRLHEYVDRTRIPKPHTASNAQEAWTNLRPLTLDLWLQGLSSSRETRRDIRHEFA